LNSFAVVTGRRQRGTSLELRFIVVRSLHKSLLVPFRSPRVVPSPEHHVPRRIEPNGSGALLQRRPTPT
jgi:hypothetical protein